MKQLYEKCFRARGQITEVLFTTADSLPTSRANAGNRIAIHEIGDKTNKTASGFANCNILGASSTSWHSPACPKWRQHGLSSTIYAWCYYLVGLSIKKEYRRDWMPVVSRKWRRSVLGDVGQYMQMGQTPICMYIGSVFVAVLATLFRGRFSKGRLHMRWTDAYCSLNPVWYMHELKRGSYHVVNERPLDLHVQTIQFACVHAAWHCVLQRPDFSLDSMGKFQYPATFRRQNCRNRSELTQKEWSKSPTCGASPHVRVYQNISKLACAHLSIRTMYMNISERCSCPMLFIILIGYTDMKATILKYCIICESVTSMLHHDCEWGSARGKLNMMRKSVLSINICTPRWTIFCSNILLKFVRWWWIKF